MGKYNWNIEEIKEAVQTSTTFSDVLRKLNIPIVGNNSKTLKNILEEHNIDYSHFTGRAKSYKTNYVKAENYLDNNKFIKAYQLKKKLLKEKIKENKCEICGLTEWLGKPLIIQLHHINGNNTDNRLENLQMLCPNCHSQTDSYCGKANTNSIKNHCKDCGKEILKESIYCPVCSSKHKRKIKRPTKEQLILDFKELKNIKKMGIKYNVSDNAIRKWLKYYDLPFKTKELKNIYFAKYYG